MIFLAIIKFLNANYKVIYIFHIVCHVSFYIVKLYFYDYPTKQYTSLPPCLNTKSFLCSFVFNLASYVAYPRFLVVVVPISVAKLIVDVAYFC